MRFKYALGARVLYRHREAGKPDTECVGQIYKVTTEITKTETKVRYWIVGQVDGLTDSDILGIVTVKRTPPSRVRRRNTSQTELPISNGKTEHMDDIHGAGCDPSAL